MQLPSKSEKCFFTIDQDINQLLTEHHIKARIEMLQTTSFIFCFKPLAGLEEAWGAHAPLPPPLTFSAIKVLGDIYIHVQNDKFAHISVNS